MNRKKRAGEEFENPAADQSAEAMWLAERRKHSRRLVTAVIVGAVFVILMLSVVVALFFKVETVTVSGCEIYEDWRILDAAAIESGINLYAIDKRAIERSILEKFSYIADVSIRRKIPSGLEIVVTEDKPFYYSELGGEYFVLSDTLRVLERSYDLENLMTRMPHLRRLVTLSVSRAIVGERIHFRDEDYYDYACEMLAIFTTCNLAEGITLIDFSDRYDIYVVYDDRFKIEIGDMDSLSLKMTTAEAILSSLSQDYTGLLNVSDDPSFVRLGRLESFLAG